jgi:DNA polymerase-3 subunit alpha/error-prone DNA polymerase
MSLLNARSHHSLLWGTASPADLLRRAGELGHRAIAVADHASLAALPALLRETGGACRPIVAASFPTGPGPASTLALVEDAAGYANLCRIVTAWHAGKPSGNAALREVIGDATAGLLFLSSSRDLLSHLRERDAAAWHLLTSPGPIPRWVGALGLPAAFAPEAVFLDGADREAHRLLRAIAGRKPISSVTPAEMAAHDPLLPPAADLTRTPGVPPEALRAAEEIAERASFLPATTTVFPPAPGDGPREPAIEVLRRRAYEGAVRRYGEIGEAVIDRLEYELDLIGRKGFAEYFLVVEEIVTHSPRTCGRGSGAASLVNYCLGVTNVDPLRYSLMFERFLNEGRTDPPDIDIDFAWDEREGVLNWVMETYGGRRAAMVCNHLSFRPKMAVRETARCFGMTEEEIGRFLEETPGFSWSPYDHGGGRFSALKPGDFPDPWGEILRLASRIVGLPRLLSLHCGGVVIVPDELAARVPVTTSAKGLPMIQWEKDGTEEMGLVKIDLLGNRSLAVIRDAARAVARREGRDAATVLPPYPADDPATRKLVASGETMGIFYVESPAMRLLQMRSGTGDFEHLVIHSSIIRPAANRWITEYLERLHGKPWEPLHPRLDGLFTESYGVPIYQEDVSKLAMALAGFSFAEADRLRKCLGKNDAARRLATICSDFVAGGRRLGVPQEIIETCWEMIGSFSGYSFCKPHSASYAQVSYESAWLKAHYPADFMAAVISNGGGYYTAQAYVSEAMRLGLSILGPDVNRSAWEFREEHGGVRVGLMAVEGLTVARTRGIVAEREESGPFSGIANLVARCRPDPEDLQRLCAVGALDSLAPELNRPQLLWMIGRERSEAGDAGRLFASGPRVPKLPPFTARQRMEAEFAGMGFLVGGHPIDLWEEELRPLVRRLIPATAIPRHIGEKVTLAGWPITGKVVGTKRDEEMEFFTFEDRHAIYETVLFPDPYRRYSRLLRRQRPFLVTGKVEEEFGACTVNVERIAPVTDSDRC